MVVFLHEEEVCDEENYDCRPKVYVVVYRTEDHAKLDSELKSHVDERDIDVRHL